MFDVKLIGGITERGIRKTSFETCPDQLARSLKQL